MNFRPSISEKKILSNISTTSQKTFEFITLLYLQKKQNQKFDYFRTMKSKTTFLRLNCATSAISANEKMRFTYLSACM